MTDFDRIFLKYHHQLFLYTVKFIENESEALDLVQDVFCRYGNTDSLLKLMIKPGLIFLPRRKIATLTTSNIKKSHGNLSNMLCFN